MVRTLITSKGQTTIPLIFRKKWTSREVLWEDCSDGSLRVRAAPDPMTLFGSAASTIPKDPKEKTKARTSWGL